MNMEYKIIIIIFFLILEYFRITNATWVWLGGSNKPYSEGTYGTIGVPDPDNIPGYRARSLSWTHPDGTFYLFGGEKYPHTFNDLWKYDGTYWTWISGSNEYDSSGTYGKLGVPLTENIPPGRFFSATWTHPNGNLFLFGGLNNRYEFLNDLWVFNGTLWTWISGSNTTEIAGTYGSLGIPSPENMPGCRYLPNTWTYPNGDLYLFGGGSNCIINIYSLFYLLDGDLNDLWLYNGTLWTWISGSNTTDIANLAGTYGSLGIPSPENMPGGRANAVSWIHPNGDLYLYGGNSLYNVFNDLWRYDWTYWTWISGSNLSDDNGNYGILGVPSFNNLPSSRHGQVSWIHPNGNIYIYGGFKRYYGADYIWLVYHDIWVYDGTFWTWISGTNATTMEIGIYGTLGIPSADNFPPTRAFANSWDHPNGNLYLFGGDEYRGKYEGDELYLEYGDRNDLWAFIIDDCPIISIIGYSFTIISGSCSTKYCIIGTKIKVYCDFGFYGNSSSYFSCFGGFWNSTINFSCQSNLCLNTVKPGYYCPSGSTSSTNVACSIGSYCPGDGGIYPCDAGYYGSMIKLFNSSCSGPCDPGYWGTYGKTSSYCSGKCDAGYYCPFASIYGQECPSNTFCPMGSDSPIACPQSHNITHFLIESPPISNICYVVPIINSTLSYFINEDCDLDFQLFYLFSCNIYPLNHNFNISCYDTSELICFISSFPLHGTLFLLDDSSPFSSTNEWPETIISYDSPNITTGFENFRYKPRSNYYGNDSFSFTLCRNTISIPLCHTSLIFININPVNDIPYWNNIYIPTFEVDGTIDEISFDFYPYMNDVDFDDLSLKIVNLPSFGTFFNSNHELLSIGSNFSNTLFFNPNEGNTVESLQLQGSIILKIFDLPNNKYSFDKDFLLQIQCKLTFYPNIWLGGDICISCPPNAICSRDGSHLPLPKYGFWKSDNPISPWVFLQCEPSEACLQGTIDYNDNCALGYTGRRCGFCTNGYFRLGKKCTECPKDANILMYSILSILVLLFALIVVKGPNISFLIIAVTYIQSLAVVSKIRLSWPDQVVSTFNFFSSFNFNIDVLSIECDLPDFSWTQKYYLMILFPPVILGMITIITIIMILKSLFSICLVFFYDLEDQEKIDFYKKYRNDISTNISLGIKGVLFSLNIIYITLSSSIVELFDCTMQSDGIFYLDADPGFICYGDKWNSLLKYGIIGIFCYIIGIPLLYCFVLSQRPLDIHSRKCCWFFSFPKFERIYQSPFCHPPKKRDEQYLKWFYKFRVLVNNFNKRCYYWEIPILFRKLSISISKIFASNYPLLQACMCIIVFILSFLLQVAYEPWNYQSYNQMEFVSLFSSIFILLGGIMCYSEPAFKQPHLRNIMDYIMMTFLITSFLVIFLGMIKAFYESVIKSKKQKMLNSNDSIDDFKSLNSKNQLSPFQEDKNIKGIINEQKDNFFDDKYNDYSINQKSYYSINEFEQNMKRKKMLMDFEIKMLLLEEELYLSDDKNQSNNNLDNDIQSIVETFY